MAEQTSNIIPNDLAYAGFVGFVIGQTDLYEREIINAKTAMDRILKRAIEFKRDIWKEESQ